MPRPPEGFNRYRRDLRPTPERHEGPSVRVEGELKVVVDALVANKRAIENGDAAPNNVVLVLPGGGLPPFTAAFTMALEEAGLTDAFSTVYGFSAGAANGAHFLAGEADKNKRMHLLATLPNLFKGGFAAVPTLKSKNIEKVATGKIGKSGRRNLNLEKMRASRPDFMIGVTKRGGERDGELLFVDAKGQEDPVGLIGASTMYPTPNQGFGKTIEIDGQRERVTDGGIGDPMPVEKIATREGASAERPLYMLVLANAAEETRGPGRLAVTAMKAYLPKGTVEKIAATKELKQKGLEWLRSAHEPGSITYAYVSPAGLYDSLHIPTRAAARLIAEAKKEFGAHLAEAQDSAQKAA